MEASDINPTTEAEINERLIEYQTLIIRRATRKAYDNIHVLTGITLLSHAGVTVFALITADFKAPFVFGSQLFQAMVFGLFLFFNMLLVGALATYEDLFASVNATIFFTGQFLYALVVLLVDFTKFVAVFPYFFNFSDTTPVCGQIYCSGWRATPFFIFYMLVFGSMLATMGIVVFYYRIFVFAGLIEKLRQPHTDDQSYKVPASMLKEKEANKNK